MENSKSFNNRVHFLGRVTVIMALACFLSLPFILGMVYSVDFDIVAAFQNGFPIMLTFAISGICENLSFAPMIGCGALYMACVTGNVSNMKIPAALNAMEVSGHASGTEKGDVIALIAVAASTAVTTVIVFMGMMFLAPLFQPIYNNPFLQPAFTNMVPALYGALVFPQIAKSPKQAIVPILLPILVRLANPAFFSANSSYIMVAVIIVSALYSVMLHKNAARNAAG